MTRWLWVCAAITVLSAVVSAGFSVAALLGPGGGEDLARYAAARSVALLLGALYVVGRRQRGGVQSLALVMTAVQAFDGVIGVLAHDPAKTYGPFAFALLNGGALLWAARAERSLRRLSDPARSPTLSK